MVGMPDDDETIATKYPDAKAAWGKITGVAMIGTMQLTNMWPSAYYATALAQAVDHVHDPSGNKNVDAELGRAVVAAALAIAVAGRAVVAAGNRRGAVQARAHRRRKTRRARRPQHGRRRRFERRGTRPAFESAIRASRHDPS